MIKEGSYYVGSKTVKLDNMNLKKALESKNEFIKLAAQMIKNSSHTQMHTHNQHWLCYQHDKSKFSSQAMNKVHPGYLILTCQLLIWCHQVQNQRLLNLNKHNHQTTQKRELHSNPNKFLVFNHSKKTWKSKTQN